MIVKLQETQTDFRDLTPGQPYVVIGIEADDYRILNDHGQPFLYANNLFQIIDPRIPAEWIQVTGEDGESYAYPVSLNATGFFEDFFDEKEESVSTFWRVVNSQLVLSVESN